VYCVRALEPDRGGRVRYGHRRATSTRSRGLTTDQRGELITCRIAWAAVSVAGMLTGWEVDRTTSITGEISMS
jgi:hypothetical protein